MKARLMKLWNARAPRERKVLAALAVVMAVAIYATVIQSATQARTRLGPAVNSLRTQAALLDQHAQEVERLRAMPAPPAASTDLRSLVQTQIGTAGMNGALVRIDAPSAGQVQVVFGPIPFFDWLSLVSALQLQRVRLDTCKIEAAPTAGLVSVTATFAGTKS